jgi:hypothetical protein
VIRSQRSVILVAVAACVVLAVVVGALTGPMPPALPQTLWYKTATSALHEKVDGRALDVSISQYNRDEQDLQPLVMTVVTHPAWGTRTVRALLGSRFEPEVCVYRRVTPPSPDLQWIEYEQ